jgi:type IV secretory pathway VirB4 component
VGGGPAVRARTFVGARVTRPTLRVSWHRGTTAHLSSIYPFSVQGSAGVQGPYIGLDLLAGGAEFCWDPFEAYGAGAATNPNCWVLGEPGNGKSALVKSLLWRMSAIYGAGDSGRWIAIADPKGEYVPLAARLGMDIVRLAPGGTTRINPLASGPTAAEEPKEQRVVRRAELVGALAATVLGRPLTQVEDAVVFAAVERLTASPSPLPPALGDVAALVHDPPADLRARIGPTATTECGQLGFALDKLLTRSLRGMFDGQSTVTVDPRGPGLLLDLSAVPLDSEALPLVMVASAAWLSQVMSEPGPRRVQVLDEAWALVANRHTARYLQTCFKLGRAYGVANICITHRPSDLAAQADDGTSTAKIAAGLLADAATKIVLRQAPDQLEAAATAFGLTEPERTIVGQLVRGRALWKVAGRSAVVHHLLAPGELDLVDTDARMLGTERAA